MKEKNKIFFMFFIVIFLALFIFVLLNYSAVYFILQEFILDYGYVGIFLGGFLADVLEQPIGPEIPAIAGVFFGLNIFLVFVFVSFGSFLGGLVSYVLGHGVLSRRVMDSCSTKKYGNYCRFFERHGKLSLFVAAVSPVPFVFFCWMSGAFYMRFKDFLLYGSLPRVFRIGIVLLLVKLLI